jgi:putative tryptophan/tyrosine transport system substrate-binding protein
MVAEHQRLHITRRRLVQGAGVAGLGLLAGCGRWPGQASTPKVARIAYVGNAIRYPAFREGLEQHGYVEGQNLVIETRWTAGESMERYLEMAEDVVRLRPDVVVTGTTPQTRAVKQVTSSIPIVFVSVSDAVGVGFVASLARPGGNLTGQSDFFAGLSGKRLELLRQVVPSAGRVAALWNPTNPATVLEWNSVQDAGGTLGLEILPIVAHSRDDLVSAFGAMLRERPDALIVLTDGQYSVANSPQILPLVVESRLPTMYYARDGVAGGMLMSYGPNFDSLYRRAAYYVDRILKGSKPADLPVEQPREFDFLINLKTAQALGLTIPTHVLLQATEVIQ